MVVLGLLLSLINVPLVSGVEDGPRIVVEEDFVGVVAPGDSADLMKARGVTVTWLGSDADGSTRILWASEALEFDDGAVAEKTGTLTRDEIDAIVYDLVEHGLVDGDAFMPSAGAYGGSGVVCSTLIPDPYFSHYYFAARALPNQVCSGHLEHRLQTKLQMNTWWVFYTTKDSENTGWSSADSISSVLHHECDDYGPKNWRTTGYGEAVSPNLVHFDISGTTNWRSLACLG